MIIYQFKPKLQSLLSPLLDGLVRQRIKPVQITLLALFLSLAYGIALASFPQNLLLFSVLPFLLLLRMTLSAIAGMLADTTGQKDSFGALLSEMADQIADVVLYLPFALVPGISVPLLILVVIAGLLAEFAGVLSFSIGVPRRFDGPLGKSNRALAFSVLALLIAVGTSFNWLNTMLVLILIASLWTVINRLFQALIAAEPPKP